MFAALKHLLPDRPRPMRVWRGPFRGARIVASPRASLRKVLGLYEHELNGWLERALQQVTRLVDVGANDGYFTLGCAAAFARRGVSGEIMCFEPQRNLLAQLQASLNGRPPDGVRIEVHPQLVGSAERDGMTTLDALSIADRRNTLIKIDVEGAEVDVIAGAGSWLEASNLFVIEVHKREYLPELTRRFRDRGLELLQIDQRPLPMLGREVRDAENWWLVSSLPRAGSREPGAGSPQL